MNKEKLSHHDRPGLPQSKEDIESLTTEERYQLAYKMRLDARLRDIVDPQDDEDIEGYEEMIEELSQEYSDSDLFQFYVNSGLVPLLDEDDVFHRIHRFFVGREDTQTTPTEEIHHEAYIRLRMQGKSGLVYAELMEQLGYGDEENEIFYGSPSEPGTINYNRNLLLERFEFQKY